MWLSSEGKKLGVEWDSEAVRWTEAIMRACLMISAT